MIDNKRDNASSRVAAGLYNPIALRTGKASWKAKQLFPDSETFYLSHQTGSFVVPRPLIKPFSSIEYANAWEARTVEPGYNDFIDVFTGSSYVESNHGYGQVLKSGNLEIAGFLDESHNRWKKAGCFSSERFDDSRLSIAESGVTYDNKSYHSIILCRGIEELTGSYFPRDILRTMKGELLLIECEGLDEDVIMSSGIFILPVGNGRFKVGATYNPRDTSAEPTPEGRQELESKLSELISNPYKVINHLAGIRPASRDRKPIVGEHPTLNNLFILNGLGSKGVTLAPYFAKQLIDHILSGAPLDPEADIQRHLKFFPNA
jgi:hypothetical protein